MEGRAIFTPGIDSASAFIENEFKKIDLSYFKDLKKYRQEFVAKGKAANNVIGVLIGKSKPDEYVVFSAHYDHLGIKNNGDDKVFNGANDDASGTTAVIALAKYFKELNQNERTIIFVTFTGEEVGGYGSKFFSENIDANKVIAMFNIEMIGTESKWGKNSAYITGFEKSDFGVILQKNLQGSVFNFNPDPYPKEQLFYRSDNARLASLGVPAHTISTSKMDSEPNYHKLSDEVSTLDLDNMTEIVKSIAISSQTIVNGQDTPSRVK
jgi:Zn-dependent M28 family amino/carboxypeptidase